MTPTINSAGAVIRSDRRGRVLVSPERREALLDEFERSGLSGMAFCRMHSLTYRKPPSDRHLIAVDVSDPRGTR